MSSPGQASMGAGQSRSDNTPSDSDTASLADSEMQVCK